MVLVQRDRAACLQPRYRVLPDGAARTGTTLFWRQRFFAVNGLLTQRFSKPALVLGAALLWLHLFAFDLGLLIEGATPPRTSLKGFSPAQKLMHEGRLLSALAAYPEALDSPSAGAIDQSLVRGYLQLRHLNQGQAGVSTLACPNRSVNCLLARRMARHYDDSNIPIADSSAEMEFSWGESGHAVVSMQGMSAGHAAGPASLMVLDTGSVATILPRGLVGSMGTHLFTTRVENLGRLVTLEIVQAGPLMVGKRYLPGWIAAISSGGFETEGVLGLDMLHALGGFKLDTRTRRASFLGGRCPVERNPVVMMESGVPVMLVDIDGRPHRALIDTGSTHSYVFDRSAGASAMRIRSDFGDVHLQGEIRASMIRVDGKVLTGQLVHTHESGRFITGTTALLGADVLFSGSTFGLCFEPARLWID